MTLAATNWIHRQIQRTKTSDAIELEVSNLTRGSSFLYNAQQLREQQQQQKQEDDEDQKKSDIISHEPAVLHRRELQLGRVLGEGNFAQVVEVIHVKSERMMAVPAPTEKQEQNKLEPDQPPTSVGTRPATSSSKRYVIKQLKRKDKHEHRKYVKAAVDLVMEAKYLSNLDHPNIIKVRGVSSSWNNNGTTSLILMDRLTETLDQRLLRWKEDIDETSGKLRRKSRLLEVANYALQIADAVQYVHSFRIIIRDLKDSNIGFLPAGSTASPFGGGRYSTVQLFDFGLCRELPPIPAHGTGDSECFFMTMAGSLRYMAPEVVNSRCYGLKADCFSWAIVLFQMITLEKPYGNLYSTASMYKKHVCQDGAKPAFPENGTSAIMTKNLHSLIERAWAHDITARLSIKEASAELQNLMETEIDPKDNRDNRSSKSSNMRITSPLSASCQIQSGSSHPNITPAATCA